jgi:hypothetical protein
MQRPPLGRVAETRGKQCPETGDENAAVHRYDRSVNHIC